ncbi:MAG: division/cell wall cluster transcriptional repressor MraZ [Pontixanthobacter sp.]
MGTAIIGRDEVAGALHNYSGQALTLLGDKGRYVIPSDFRKIVKESSDGNRTLCLAKHDRWDCLVGFGLSREAELEHQLDREEDAALRLGREYDRDLRSIQLFGFEKIPFDDSGRFTMPDFLKSDGGIEDALFFRGGGKFFTVWNPELLARQGHEFNALKAGCDSLLADARAKAARK